MTTERVTPNAHRTTFEAGARRMAERLGSADDLDVSGFVANAEDPLHAAFEAKAIVHAGPGGMPLIGEAAEKPAGRSRFRGLFSFQSGLRTQSFTTLICGMRAV